MESVQLKEFDPDEFECIPGKLGHLGSGAFGVVRLAIHKVLGPVALKCFSTTAGPSIEEMIRNELSHHQTSNNENVVRLYGWTKWKGVMAIVMEYCNYGSLEDILLNSSVSLSVSVTLQMCSEIAGGIASVHNVSKLKRMVHCDIKPGNILASKKFQCKLSDFGGAKLCNYTNCVTTSQLPTRDQLTLAYTPPEVLINVGLPLSKEQDTYSFAMVVHMLLTRRQPFTLPNLIVVLVTKGKRPSTKIIDEMKKTLQDLDLESVQLMQEIMESCWKQKPEERPNMLDVKKRLEKQLAKYKPSDIIGSISEAIKNLTFVDPGTYEKVKIPLTSFSLSNQSFATGRSKKPATLPKPKRTTKTLTPNASGGVSYQVSSTNLPHRDQNSLPVLKSAGPKLNKSFHQLGEPSSSAPATKVPPASTPSKETFKHCGKPAKLVTPSNLLSTSKSGNLDLIEIFQHHEGEACSKIKEYENVTTTKEYDKGSDIAKLLLALILEDKYASGDRAETYAMKLLKQEKYTSSTLFFYLAGLLYKKKHDKKEALSDISRACSGIRATSANMVQQQKKYPNGKDLLLHLHIPYMKELITTLHEIPNVDSKLRSRKEATCYKHTADVCLLADDAKSMEASLMKLTEIMDESFGAEAHKYSVYASGLTQLGVAKLKKENFKEACDYFKQAIDSYKNAGDESDEDKQKRIEVVESYLRITRTKLL